MDYEQADVQGGWRGSSVSPSILKSPRKKPVARDPFQEALDTSDWISSIAPDPLPEDEEPSASIPPDPVPKIEEPSPSIALDPLPEIEEPHSSIAPDPLPEIEDPSASSARDLLLGDEGEGEGEVSDYDNDGMGEDEIQDLLGDSYNRDVEKKF